MGELLAEAFGGGGLKVIIMSLIMFFLVVVLVLGAWRAVLLWFKYDTPNAAGIWAQIYKHVTNNRIEDAIRLCESANDKNNGRILLRVWKKGLQSAGKSAEETQNAIESASLERLPAANRYINWFGTLANVTTLLGLLGTISGLIGGFKAVSNTSGAAKQSILAGEISHALWATAFGLGTALVAMVIHGFLTTKSNLVTEQVDEFAAKLVELLQMRRNNLAAKEGKSEK